MNKVFTLYYTMDTVRIRSHCMTTRTLYSSLIVLAFILCSCELNRAQELTSKPVDSAEELEAELFSISNPEGMIISTRFKPPEYFNRLREDSASFASYLRNTPLKQDDALVEYYHGGTKPNNDVYVAVFDQKIGERDLHQCADAVMRMRADYLRDSGKAEEIHFNFTNGFNAEYAKWMEGYRISVSGNDVKWNKTTSYSDSDASYWKYLEMVFSYAGTLSLEKELVSVSIDDMRIGDVFIQGGSPGHAILIVDMAENPETGQSVFMLAQSYMPAQQMQILQNPMNDEISPWYSAEETLELYTPEWTFTYDDLKRFHD